VGTLIPDTMQTTCKPVIKKTLLHAMKALTLGLIFQSSAMFGLDYNVTLSSLTAHNTSAYFAYNETNFGANFGTTTWINQNGQTMPVDPTQADESLNPVTPGHVSNMDVHTLVPSRPDLRWFAHATPWFGTSSHIKIGLTNNTTAYVAAMITDMKNRGFNGVIIDWYGMTDGTDGVVQKIKSYLAGLPNNTFTYIIMVDGGIKGGTGLPNLETNINYCKAQYFSDPNYEHEPLATGQPILMFFGVRNAIGQANMNTVKSDTGGNMVWVEQGTGYLGETWEDECFLWTDEYDHGVNYSDPFNLSSVTNKYVTIKNSGKKAFGAMCSQFDGTLTKTTNWSKGKYLPCSNGLCLVERAASVNTAIFANMTRMQWPTWSDWEEGTEVEAGIEDQVTFSVQTNTTGTLSWTVTGGEAKAIDHYELYASINGTTAALITSLPASTTQIPISKLNLPAGAYSMYVYAVGIPCVRNHLSAPVSVVAGEILTPTDFSRQMKITFSGYNRSTGVTNFPLLVELSTAIAGFSYSQFESPAGYDLRFADANGNTLAYEIDQWNTSGVSTVWVNVPKISSSADYIMAYWGNRADTNVPSWCTNGAVWLEDSAVFHLKEGGFPYADGTTSHPASSGTAPAITTSGKIGNAEVFDGATQYLAPAGSINLGNSFSLSAWINLNASAGNIQTIWDNKNTGGSSDGVALYVNSYNTTDGKLTLETGDGVSGLTANTSAGAVPVGGWHHVFASVNRTAGTAQLYVDGANVTANGAIANDLGNTGIFNLGRFTNSSWYFKGTLDEARIEPIRSADWVWTTWMNVASNSVLANYSTVTLTKALDQDEFSSAMKLTFSGYTHSTALTNFPVLINFSTAISGFSYNQFASPNGYDLRFTDASGQILCPFEIDTWNTNGTSSVWVLVPLINSSTNYIIAYWGNPALVGTPPWQNTGATWTNYSAVYHLKESGFPYADSTTLHSATSGTAPAVTGAGKIANAEVFDGSTDYLAPSGAVNLGNSFSLSAWVNLNASAGNIQGIWANKSGGGTANGIAFFVNTYNTTDGKLLLETGDGTAGLVASSSAGAVPVGGWHHVFASVNRGSGTAALYVDGANVTVTNTVMTDFLNNGSFQMGRFTNSFWYLKGTLDEARIEPMRSPDWVWATWMNMASNATFVSYPAVVVPNVFSEQPPQALAISTDLTAHALRFNWTAQDGRYSLFSTTNLVSPVQWTPVSNYMILPDGSVQVPMSNAPSGATFYRLQHQ